MVAKNTQKGVNCRGMFNGERLFVAVVKLAIKQKDKDFLCRNERLEILAGYLGVSYKVCDCIRIKLRLPLNL